MYETVNDCPFCGGNAQISFRQGKYMGQNAFGDKKMKYVLQVICNRCHSRGKPITTDWLVNPNRDNIPEDYRDEAARAWNKRITERPKGKWDYGTECSVCHRTIIPPKDRKVRVNFCPWCGADMQ